MDTERLPKVSVRFETELVPIIKFSLATSRVKWLKGEKANVSRTISVLVVRELVLSGEESGHRVELRKQKVGIFGSDMTPLTRSLYLSFTLNSTAAWSVARRTVRKFFVLLQTCVRAIRIELSGPLCGLLQVGPSCFENWSHIHPFL
jgi:hypothetical protein